MLSRRRLLSTGFATLLAGLAPPLPGLAAAAQPAAAANPDVGARARELRRQGAAWLRERQGADGAFAAGHPFSLGITQMALLALAADGLGRGDAPAARALAHVAAHRGADGSCTAPAAGVAVYTTALWLQIGAALGLDPDPAAQRWLLARQRIHDGDPADGGWAVQEGGMPDLHASLAAIEGLVDAGLPADHPGIVRARRFLAACQNRYQGPGDRSWSSRDGGGIYSPDPRTAAGHDDPTLEAGPQRPASTGSMSYALLSGFALVGLDPGDARVQALLAWLRTHYGFAAHPGMPPGRRGHGLFAYHHAAAKALHLAGAGAFARAEGDVVDWRADLLQAIADHAQAVRLGDGSLGLRWQNSAPRWAESVAELATAYQMQALAWIAA